jgi:hypothetical protein
MQLNMHYVSRILCRMVIICLYIKLLIIIVQIKFPLLSKLFKLPSTLIQLQWMYLLMKLRVPSLAHYFEAQSLTPDYKTLSPLQFLTFSFAELITPHFIN